MWIQRTPADVIVGGSAMGGSTMAAAVGPRRTGRTGRRGGRMAGMSAARPVRSGWRGVSELDRIHHVDPSGALRARVQGTGRGLPRRVYTGCSVALRAYAPPDGRLHRAGDPRSIACRAGHRSAPDA